MFQSTHPRGVRLLLHSLCGRNGGFQSTHPRGVRHTITGENADQAAVSIHAPARGATSNSLHDILRNEFQSTHPRGVRLLIVFGIIKKNLFQSTHPRGVRRQRTASGTWPAIGFNPRTREGCDFSKYFTQRQNITVSIHAPARGATRETG